MNSKQRRVCKRYWKYMVKVYYAPDIVNSLERTYGKNMKGITWTADTNVDSWDMMCYLYFANECDYLMYLLQSEHT